MGLLSRLGVESKGQDVYSRWLDMMEFGAMSKSGVGVTQASMFRVSAALACIRAISQGMAQVPFKLMQSYEDGPLTRKREARTHQLFDVIYARPNAWQTSFEFIETLVMHACMGNAYVFKNRYRGKVAELFLLNPSQVQAKQESDWSITYTATGKNGERVPVPASDIWHIRGPSIDGFLGMDVLGMARDALGLSMALENSHASLHANSIRPSGIYSVEGTLKDDQHKQLTTWLKAQAAAGTGTPLVLDRNAKWLSQAMSGMDAQHLETRQHQIEEVCRFFGVLPTIIGYTGDKANTYASAEVQETAHKVRTLGPWYKRIQDSANVNLLADIERREQGYYFKFVTNALMAASAKDRGEFYARALGSGGSPAFMTQDEVRALEDLDPMGGDASLLPIATNKPAAPAAGGQQDGN